MKAEKGSVLFFTALLFSSALLLKPIGSREREKERDFRVID